MAERIWTCKDVLSWTTSYLERAGDEHPRLSAEWLLSAATGLSRIELYTSFDKPLSAAELDAMHAGIERRVAGEPLQYVTGETPFRHIVVRCEPGVLIPRPETEILVDHVLAELDRTRGDDGRWQRVVEVGCGTGCVAGSIAYERPETFVLATDISPVAAALARRNIEALSLGSRVDVVECDLVSGIDERLMGSFDVLVSNPPYIPDEVMGTLPHEVADFEPELALAGGDDGLDVYRRLLDAAPRLLRAGGCMAVELFEGHLDAAASLMREQGGWARVEVHEDLTHRPRVLVGVRE